MTTSHQQRYQTRRRAWLFTINNPLAMDKPMFNSDRMNYLIFQLEKGTNGTPHYQGYVYFKNECTMRTCKRYISQRAHLTAAEGSPQENKKYCSKREGRLKPTREFGVIPKKRQGNRSDLIQVKKMIDDGKSSMEVAKSHFGSWCRYNKSFMQYRLMVQGKRRWKTRTIIIYGRTGIGKSTLVHEKLENAWCKGPGTKWFDSYCGEEDVIFDDMNTPWVKHDMMKRLMDKFPLMIEFKGGYVNWTPKRLMITTNVHPQAWYAKLGERRPDSWLELERRIDLLVKKTSTGYEIEIDNGSCPDELAWFTSPMVVLPSPPPQWLAPINIDRELSTIRRDFLMAKERMVKSMENSLDESINEVNVEELSIDLLGTNLE